ncbi:MAG: GIY-YIG nuclease family protein [Acetobacterium sp.]|nr:GIY-YIG nuclease family protein [Bacillota bacterium]MDP2842104.1 GIY-YIG nuclease family protein [Acetobacterium sp.]
MKKKDKQMIDKAYVYIVKCSDKTLYTGWTSNIDARIKVHNSGTGAKYTRGRLPVTLVYWEVLDSRSQALSREAVIKKMSKAQKISLIESYKRKINKEFSDESVCQ